MDDKFRLFAIWVSEKLGSSKAFIIVFFIVLMWFVWYYKSGWKDTANLAGNIAISILTLFVCLLSLNTQNRNECAVHVKLDALIEASSASNRFVGLHDCTDDELKEAVAFIKSKR